MCWCYVLWIVLVMYDIWWCGCLCVVCWLWCCGLFGCCVDVCVWLFVLMVLCVCLRCSVCWLWGVCEVWDMSWWRVFLSVGMRCLWCCGMMIKCVRWLRDFVESMVMCVLWVWWWMCVEWRVLRWWWRRVAKFSAAWTCGWITLWVMGICMIIWKMWCWRCWKKLFWLICLGCCCVWGRW